jgi:hypothetical protein
MELVDRKATYKPYAQAIPGGFAIEKSWIRRPAEWPVRPI